MSTTTRVIYTAGEGGVLKSAQILVGAAFAHDGTNYWTITLRCRRAARPPFPAQTSNATAETVGSISTKTRDLAAGKLETLYSVAAGLAMTVGDSLTLDTAPTGSPAALTALQYVLKGQRITR